MMIAMWTALLLGSAADVPVADRTPTIIVTGRPLAETQRALADCIARRCPPDAEIDRTLAHVENQFIAGRYRDARSVLNRAVARNDRFAGAHPRAVADLYRVTGRIAIHLGEGEAYRRAVHGIGRSIRAGLPDDSVESLTADIETGEMNASLGRYDRAQAVYDDVVARARAAGRPAIAVMVRLRQAILRDRAGFGPIARRDLRTIASARDPATMPFAAAARILLARIDRRDGKHDSTEAVIAEFARDPAAVPILLYAPDVADLPPRSGLSLGGGALNRVATQTFDDVWGDFGFRIRPDGSVADVELLRDSGRNPGWERPVIASLSRRRYTPFVAADGNPDGLFRVERYTLTSLMSAPTGSRIRARSPNPRYERLDLSVDPLPRAPAAAPGSRPGSVTPATP